MDILVFEESINVLAEQTQPIRFADLLQQVSQQMATECHYIKVIKA